MEICGHVNFLLVLHFVYFVLFHSSSNMSELAKGLPMLAALLADTDDANKILEAARRLADAAKGLLESALPENQAVSACGRG